MKTKKYTAFFMLYLLLQTSFLYLLPMKPYYETISLALVVMLILVNLKKINKHTYLYKKEVVIFIIFIIVDIVFTHVKHKQGLVYTLYASEHCFLILAYFLFSYYLKTKINAKKVEKIIIYFSLFLSTLFILQFILYNKNLIFLSVPFTTRFEGIRINFTTIIPSLGALFALINLFDNKNKFSFRFGSLVVLFTNVFYIIFICKVRTILLILIACSLIIWLILYRKKFWALMYFMSFFIFLVSIYIYYTQPDIFRNYISSINSDDASLTIRIDAIKYFYSQAANSPLFGIGLLYPIEGSFSSYIIKGSNLLFYSNDVGILGTMQNFGFTIIIWYIFLLVKMFRLSHRRIKDNNLASYGMLITYIFLTSFTLIITDKYRSFMLPIILALIESYCNNEKKGEVL